MKGLIRINKSEVGKNRAKLPENDDDFTAFIELAALMNVSLTQVKDECCCFQMKKLMSKLGKVLVRYNVKEKEIEKILENSKTLDISEVLISTAYLSSVKKRVIKNSLGGLKVCTIIDFPFGEGLFKSKLAEAKNCIKQGVDGVTVVLPTMMANDENVKALKKQTKKIARLTKESSIAISCGELSDGEIKNVLRVAEKTKIKSVTFLFGEMSLIELQEKARVINDARGKKQIRVLGNVDSAAAVMELFKRDVDCLLTPFADDIGKELVKRFKIKSLKLK